MRLLHPGANLFGGCGVKRKSCEQRGRNPRMDEREYLSLRRVSEHSGCDQRSEDEGSRMNPFTYSRAEDANQAVTAVSGKPQSKFLGGGTNLIDLMKMGVETPN